MSEKQFITQALTDVSAARDSILKLKDLAKINYRPDPGILEEIRDVLADATAEAYAELGITQVTVKDPMGINLLNEAIDILMKYEKGMKSDDILQLIHQARSRIRNVRYRETPKNRK